jgi:hypothetical protein
LFITLPNLTVKALCSIYILTRIIAKSYIFPTNTCFCDSKTRLVCFNYILRKTIPKLLSIDFFKKHSCIQVFGTTKHSQIRFYSDYKFLIASSDKSVKSIISWISLPLLSILRAISSAFFCSPSSLPLSSACFKLLFSISSSILEAI